MHHWLDLFVVCMPHTLACERVRHLAATQGGIQMRQSQHCPTLEIAFRLWRSAVMWLAVAVAPQLCKAGLDGWERILGSSRGTSPALREAFPATDWDSRKFAINPFPFILLFATIAVLSWLYRCVYHVLSSWGGGRKQRGGKESGRGEGCVPAPLPFARPQNN